MDYGSGCHPQFGLTPSPSMDSPRGNRKAIQFCSSNFFFRGTIDVEAHFKSVSSLLNICGCGNETTTFPSKLIGYSAFSDMKLDVPHDKVQPDLYVLQ